MGQKEVGTVLILIENFKQEPLLAFDCRNLPIPLHSSTQAGQSGPAPYLPKETRR